MANIPKPYPFQRGKIFDVNIIQSVDVFNFIRALGKFKYFYRPVEKAMSKNLLLVQTRSQNNMTKMNTTLSGWMRNQFGRVIMRPTPDSLLGRVFTTAWYSYMVHEGLGPHASGGKWVEGKGITPDDVYKLQIERLKFKKTKIKGPRPFMKNAVDESINEIRNNVYAAVSDAIRRVYKQYDRPKVRKPKGMGV